MPIPFEFHRLVNRGNLSGVRELLQADPQLDVNRYDHRGYTPLMYALENRNASVELVRLLLEHGANIDLELSQQFGGPLSMLAICLRGGDPDKLAVLIEAGADIRYRDQDGYDALLDVAGAPYAVGDPKFLDLLKLIMAHGVSLSTITKYEDSALRVLSNQGRFDAVKVLLEAGADETQLAWTPLIRAVALGSLAEVEEVLESGAELEERDLWSRTAYLIAVQAGDVSKANFLRERGADIDARGRCGTPSSFYAIENHHLPMLEWLLEIGTSPEQTDDFETTPLVTAVKCDNAAAVALLLRAGADVNRQKKYGQTALSDVKTAEIATLLLDAGADPAKLSFEGRRSLLGLAPEPDEALLDVSEDDFRKGWSRRFGSDNPQRMAEPFWESMIRAGITAFQGAQRYGRGPSESPIWCAQRFGQSLTQLPDGRIVQIAGEHEAFYDEDFCIYNDVFVHHPDGSVDIYGYPESIFPPTDFHTATLVGEYIYIVGSLAYQGTRNYGVTPISRLNTRTFQMEQVTAAGNAPGWIFEHRASQTAAHEIRIWGGKIATSDGVKEAHIENDRAFILDTERLMWRVDGG